MNTPDLRELFETEYADRFGMLPSEVKSARLGEDSYNSLTVARCFRFFCAGFNANDAGKMRVIGYMSKKGIEEVGVWAAVKISPIPTESRVIEIMVKDGELHKKGAL